MDVEQGHPGLSPEQRRTLEDARLRARRIVSASRVAAFNGWTIGAFAVLTLLFGLGSPVVLVLGAGMVVVARNELRGRAGLRRFEPEAARMLGRNQIAFMALIVAYCLWSLWRSSVAPPEPEMALLEEVAGLGPDLVRQLTGAVYVSVILATVLFQGLNARFYFKRVPMIRAYLADVPQWVVDLQRSARID